MLDAMPIERTRLDHAVDELRGPLTELSKKIHENPELRYEEHLAAAWLADAVEKHAGVSVERKTGGLATAFRAKIGNAAGPCVAVLAEYDALPEIGHACGHNLIAGGAGGAFLALAKNAKELPGSIVLLGT